MIKIESIKWRMSFKAPLKEWKGKPQIDRRHSPLHLKCKEAKPEGTDN